MKEELSIMKDVFSSIKLTKEDQNNWASFITNGLVNIMVGGIIVGAFATTVVKTIKSRLRALLHK